MMHCPGWPGEGSAASNPLSIALLTYSTKPRGSVIHTLELATALHGLGHQVCVYALDKDGTGFDYPLPCAQSLIPARPAPADLDALIQQRIQEFVRGMEPCALRHDIYHAQDCLSANALAHLRQRGAIAHLVRTVHHLDNFSSPYLQQCQDRSIREADLCVCVSDRWQRELEQRYGVRAERVINGVNRHRFSPVPTGADSQLRDRLGLTGHPIYLTVGGVEPRKNSLTLLQSFAQVRSTHPHAQLVIAGGATLFDYHTYRQDFLAQVEALGLEQERSLLLPGVLSADDLATLYRVADAFVFPSVTEGWGLVVMEAIAAGLPVLTSRQAPFTEYLSPEQAMLVNPTSVPAIAQAMCEMVEPERSRQLVRQSQSVLDHYTWAAAAQSHLHHYRRLLIGSLSCVAE